MRRRMLPILLSLALCLSLLPTAALAAGDSVEYLAYNEKDGTFTSATKNDGEYIVISESSAPTTWGEAGQTKWYVAQGDVTISNYVTVTGDVHLILQDNCTLTVNDSIRVTDNGLTLVTPQLSHKGSRQAPQPHHLWAVRRHRPTLCLGQGRRRGDRRQQLRRGSRPHRQLLLPPERAP